MISPNLPSHRPDWSSLCRRRRRLVCRCSSHKESLSAQHKSRRLFVATCILFDGSNVCPPTKTRRPTMIYGSPRRRSISLSRGTPTNGPRRCGCGRQVAQYRSKITRRVRWKPAAEQHGRTRPGSVHSKRIGPIDLVAFVLCRAASCRRILIIVFLQLSRRERE